MDQVSALIAWYLRAHALWQPGLHMHDGALEKEKGGVLKKTLVFNDLLVLLLTLAEKTAEKFERAFWDTCIS